jgi:hypothetical protein
MGDEANPNDRQKSSVFFRYFMTTRNPGLFSISDNKNNLIIFLLYLYTVQYAMTKCINV